MRGAQFLATAINNTEHPCFYMHDHPQTPRQIVQTPHRYYTDILQNIPPPHGQTSLKKHIHTHITQNAPELIAENKVLNAPPPNISSTETQLSRQERVHLARFRCGHHPSLQAKHTETE